MLSMYMLCILVCFHILKYIVLYFEFCLSEVILHQYIKPGGWDKNVNNNNLRSGLPNMVSMGNKVPANTSPVAHQVLLESGHG